MPPPSSPPAQFIILFDGECNFCNRSAAFIMKRDRRQRFAFASSRSPAGQKLAAAHGFTGETPGSVVLVIGDRAYSKSTASLEIARRLDRLWPALYAFIIIPAFIRDAVYGFIAARRRRWFGTADQCIAIPPGRRAGGAEGTGGGDHP